MPVSKLVDLNKPATVQVSEFQGVNYLSLRYMYSMPDGQLGFGKNGVNIPIEWGKRALEALVEVYNQATGSSLELVGDNAVPDPELDET